MRFVASDVAQLGLDRNLGLRLPFGWVYVEKGIDVVPTHFVFPPLSLGWMSTAMRGSGLGLASPPRCELEVLSHRKLQRILGDFAA